MMTALRESLRRLVGTFRGHRADQDLEEELRIHLEMLAEDGERQGHSREEAMRLARLSVGGAAQAMEEYICPRCGPPASSPPRPFAATEDSHRSDST